MQRPTLKLVFHLQILKDEDSRKDYDYLLDNPGMASFLLFSIQESNDKT